MTAASPAPELDDARGPGRGAGSRRRRDLLIAAGWTLLVPVVSVTTMLVVSSAWREELPDPVATGWGPSGPRDTADLTSTVWGLAAVTLLMGAAAFALAFWSGQAALTRRMANAVGAFVSGLPCGLLLVQLAAQRGLVDALDAGPIGLGVTLVVVGTLLLAAVAFALTPGDPHRPTSAPVPSDAPTVPLAEGEGAVWITHVDTVDTPWIIAASLVAVVVGITTQAWLATLLPLGLVVLALLTFMHWTVTVDSRGLRAQSRFGVLTQRVPLDEVERAEAIDVHPLRTWGGWGVRSQLDGATGVILRKGPGIEVHRTGGRRLVITVDDAAGGAALLNSLAARTRP